MKHLTYILTLFFLILTISIAWQDTVWGAKWKDVFTDEEKDRLRQMVATGELNERNIDAFLDRFSRASNRKTAFDEALSTGFSASIERDWHSIKKYIANPRIDKYSTKFLVGTALVWLSVYLLQRIVKYLIISFLH